MDVSDGCVAHIRLRSPNPDDAWKVALISGEAIGWDFRAIPSGRDDLLPHQREHLATVNTTRVRKLIEGLIHHPRQCAYAIALLDADAASREWVMHVVRHHALDRTAAVVDLIRRGIDGEWAREMLGDVPLSETGLEPHELVRIGLLTIGQAELFVERMPSGSAMAALAMHVNRMSRLSWAMRVILADEEGRDTVVRMMRAMSLSSVDTAHRRGAPHRGAPG